MPVTSSTTSTTGSFSKPASSGKSSSSGKPSSSKKSGSGSGDGDQEDYASVTSGDDLFSFGQVPENASNVTRTVNYDPNGNVVSRTQSYTIAGEGSGSAGGKPPSTALKSDTPKGGKLGSGSSSGSPKEGINLPKVAAGAAIGAAVGAALLGPVGLLVGAAVGGLIAKGEGSGSEGSPSGGPQQKNAAVPLSEGEPVAKVVTSSDSGDGVKVLDTSTHSAPTVEQPDGGDSSKDSGQKEKVKTD